MALNLTFWDNQQNPVNTTVEQLFDALRNDDMKAGLMYEPCTMDDVLDGTEPSNALIMDAIIAQYAKLTAKMNIMQRVMSRSGVDVKDSEGKTVPLTVVGYQISDPFMRLGTANVVALFELSDGQTVSIYFHNPDTTPKKITPQDEVISFKWLLNKKDITIVVAPEKGKDIDVRQVALRIMKIAAKNSAAFARQNKNRKERLERVNALRTRVAEKEKILAQKLKKIDELQYLKAQEEVDQLLEDERLMKGNITPELYAELKSLERLQDRADELDQIYQDRVLELRNELRKRHWIGERYQPLMKEGYTLLEEYHYASSGTSIISVTYRIPELDFQYTDDLSQPVAEIVEKIDGVVNVALKTALENQFQEKKEVTQQDEKLEEQSQASEEDKLGKYFEINGTMGRICFVIGKRVNNAFNKIEWATVKDDASVETYHSKVIEKYSTEDDFVKGASLFSIEVYKEKWKKLTENGFEMISFSQMETLYQNRQKYLNRMDEQPENTRQEEVAITLTGKEFGEFDTSTSEGKAALRKKAFEHIKQLVDNEESVFCSALNANVFFSQKGNRKYKSEGKGELGPIKSQLAFKLKELIASGKQYKESAESYDEKEQRSRLKYHYLKTNAIVGNQELTVKLVIRETPEKTFHYDLQLEKGFDQIFDSVDVEMATMPFLRLSKAGGDCSHSLGQNDLCLDDTAILDRTQENNANNINQVILDDTLQAKAVIALNYIAALDNSILTDSTELAEDQLIMALQVLENNLPINEQEGNVAQAELEREHIASIKEALGILQSQPALDSAESEGRYVLNLFVEYQDENGNWVELKDDEDELEAPTEEPGNDTEPENSQSAPVLLHTSSLYQGEGYRPVLEGRDEEIEQFKQAGYTLEPFSVEGRSCTYSVHKTAEPYNIHITANWYSDGKKSYWVNVSPQKGYVTDAKENNGGQAKVSGANENAKSVTEAIQLAEELIQEEKHYRPLRKEKGYISGTYFATKGRSKTYFFNVSQNLETLKYSAYIQWSSGEPKEMTFDSLTELKEGVENYFRAYVKGTLPEITLSSGTDILEINANKEDQETTVESEQSNAVGETLPELVLPENANRETLNAIAQDYLKAHLQGKRIKTSDGKIVHFNRDQSVKHFSFNAQIGALETKALTKIVEVFAKGEFIGKENLYKDRKDKFVAFHVYRKQVEINGMKYLLQTKAGEKENGELEVVGKLIGYTHKLLDGVNENGSAPPVLTSPNGERPSGGYATVGNKDTLLLDGTQEEIDDYLIEILEIRDKDGNLIDLDQLGAEQGNAIENNVEENLPELVLPENASRKELGKTVQNWLKANLQGKVITASDGNKIHFNRNDSVEHLTSDGRKGKLEALVISKIAEVFQTGEAKGREELVKPREDFVAFYRYDKWLELDGYRVQVVAKAGERTDGALESLTKLVAYSGAIYNKATLDSSYSLGLPKQALPAADLSNSGLSVNTSTILDNAQEDEPLATLTILEIRDKNGNLIDLAQLEAEEENSMEENAQKQADIQFLQDVIDCKIDVLADDFYNKLEPIATRVYAYDEELVSKAVDAYANKTDEYAIATE